MRDYGIPGIKQREVEATEVTLKLDCLTIDIESQLAHCNLSKPQKQTHVCLSIGLSNTWLRWGSKWF